jgi:glycine dehydrogenase subunit 1
MAVRANRGSTSRRILVPRSVNPTYLAVAQAIAGNQELVFESVDFDHRSGRLDVAALAPFAGQDIAALVVQSPNFFGVLEEVDALTDWAHANKALLIAVVNPLSLAVLKAPGEWGEAAGGVRGADICCGEGQPLGVPLASGGPYFGFMTTRMQYVRQMPGRVVGRTLDAAGRPGFTLTLQAREQHIRRGKATSNICTNQGLTVTAATIYMSLLGATGLERVAAACMQRTRELVAALTAIPGVSLAFGGPRFHEVLLRLDRPAGPVLAALAAQGILGGIDVSSRYPELQHALLTCATETRTDADIASYAQALAAILAVDLQGAA